MFRKLCASGPWSLTNLQTLRRKAWTDIYNCIKLQLWGGGLWICFSHQLWNACGKRTQDLGSKYRQLRARRALLLFKDVTLRTRRVLWLYKVYSDSALLVLNETLLNSVNALLALSWNCVLHALNVRYAQLIPGKSFWKVSRLMENNMALIHLWVILKVAKVFFFFFFFYFCNLGFPNWEHKNEVKPIHLNHCWLYSTWPHFFLTSFQVDYISSAENQKGVITIQQNILSSDNALLALNRRYSLLS